MSVRVSERKHHSSVLLIVSPSYETRSDNQQPSELLDHLSIRLLDNLIRNHAFKPTDRILLPVRQPQELRTKLVQLTAVSTDVRLIWKAAAVAMLQMLWRMVQLRHQRFLPNVPRLALRQLPLLHVIDVSALASYLPMPQLRISTTYKPPPYDICTFSQLRLFGKATFFY